MLQEPRSGLRPGERVLARGDHWCVAQVTGFSDCEALHLDGAAGRNQGLRRVLLYPFDRPRAIARRVSCRAVRRPTWNSACRALIASVTPYDALRTAATACLDLFPYQLEPALAVVAGLASRLLLADEVGLGKTIQAGLVLSELRARGDAERTLIATPVGLREQWANELANRFGIDASVVDAPFLRRAAASLPRGLNPWTVPGVYIASLDFIKRPEVLHALESIVWDLFVLDEAHCASGESDRGAAAHALGRRSRRVVLVTATPHAGDDLAFAAMCGIGRFPDAGTDDRLLIFRRSRADVGLPRSRKTRLLAINPSVEERAMHAVLERYVRLVAERARTRNDRDALLAMIVLTKRALSSAHSLASSVARRLEWVGIGPQTLGQIALPLTARSSHEDEELADEEPAHLLAARGLDEPAHERAWLGALYQSARTAAARESKLRVLLRLLARSTEPVIVFTEYRDTLKRLQAAVAPFGATVVLHGGLTRDERRLAETAFNSGSARVLLATDVAGQGLNLHTCCRWVINYELPWIPTRLEQRIGRVDRIGQRRTVHALHLLARGTAEADVLARLVTRLERARRSLGHVDDLLGTLPDEVIARVMLGLDRPALLWTVAGRRSTSPAPSPNDAADNLERANVKRQAESELVRLRFVRALARADRITPGPLQGWPEGTLAILDCTAPWVTMGRNSIDGERKRPAGLLWIFRASILDGTGRRIETALIPIRTPVPGPTDVRRIRDMRHSVDRCLQSTGDALHQRARREAAGRLLGINRARAPGILRARERELAIATDRHHGLAVQLVQQGLFDRRTVREQERAHQRRDIVQRETQERVTKLNDALDLSVGEVELMLVLIRS